METHPFAAPDPLAPYVIQVLTHLQLNPGLTVTEVQKSLKLGENVARAALDRLASRNLVHCTLRASKKRGSPPREYRPGPCPILVN
jgi:predicted ArsR family transcriptional regulator